jgi:hypothetical protein
VWLFGQATLAVSARHDRPNRDDISHAELDFRADRSDPAHDFMAHNGSLRAAGVDAHITMYIRAADTRREDLELDFTRSGKGQRLINELEAALAAVDQFRIAVHHRSIVALAATACAPMLTGPPSRADAEQVDLRPHRHRPGLNQIR